MSDKKPAAGLPGVGDSLELMRKMWGLTGISGVPTPIELAQLAVRLPQNLPNMVTPTIDLDEIDKRITDLRAVEQWLELNASLLRTSIQSLEVQRATIATLKGITGAMIPAALKGKPEEAVALAAFQEQLAAFQTLQAAAAAAHAQPHGAPPAGTPSPEAAATPQAAPEGGATTAFNPALWWHALQDQFTRIASAAAAGQEAPPESAPKPKTRSRAAPRKTAAKAAPRTTARKRST